MRRAVILYRSSWVSWRYVNMVATQFLAGQKLGFVVASRKEVTSFYAEALLGELYPTTVSY